MQATTAIHLDVRSTNKEGLYPIKIRVTYQGQPRYYKTGIFLSKNDFGKMMSSKSPRGKLKDIKLFLEAKEQKAVKIIKDMDVFSFSDFVRKYNAKKGELVDIFALLQECINNMKKEERDGTAWTLYNALSSLKKYTETDSFSLEKITPKWLENYEAYMLNKGRSYATIGIYMRAIRKVFNIAIARRDIKPELYPFGKKEAGLFQIKKAKKRKKALSSKDLHALINYKPQCGTQEDYYFNIWLFSYLGNGINTKDICLLKYKHINGNVIHFVRAKTAKSSHEEHEITIALIDEIKNIIDRFGNKPISPDQFIFPVLNKKMGSAEIQKNVKAFARRINNVMKQITNQLGIERVTTYSARHSFATTLKRSGVSVEYISESLGHADISTTKAYLDSFEDETIFEVTKKLLKV